MPPEKFRKFCDVLQVIEDSQKCSINYSTLRDLVFI